jgi:hypothetical protein
VKSIDTQQMFAARIIFPIIYNSERHHHHTHIDVSDCLYDNTCKKLQRIDVVGVLLCFFCPKKRKAKILLLLQEESSFVLFVQKYSEAKKVCSWLLLTIAFMMMMMMIIIIIIRPPFVTKLSKSFSTQFQK